MADVDLGGEWMAAEADEDLRRVYPDPSFDDGSWIPVTVPGHWRSEPAFAGSDGPLLYRRRFDSPEAKEGRRCWLELDGLFYQGDVWLDGSYVGDTEGYFAPHIFEVTEAVQARADHVLAIEVTCSPQRDGDAKRNITGVFQHWDCIDPRWNPGGIWRPMRLVTSGPARITSLRALCPQAREGQAVLRLRANVDTKRSGAATLTTTVEGVSHVDRRTLAEGENRLQWEVVVGNPRLWWPHALGEQALTDVQVDLAFDGEEEVTDSRSFTTGLRTVTMKRWQMRVNGERLFLKGTNVGPTRMNLAAATVEEIEATVSRAKAAGLDLLRVHGHVARPELYDAADRAGMLLWQDFPLQWSYGRGVRKQAQSQARAMVDLLGHHPSVAIWCGHNEPYAHGEGSDELEWSPKAVASHALPTWNKTILDTAVKRAIEKADGTRPVVAHSGVLPHPGSTGTDTHLYFGWYWGDERDLERAVALWPNLARFVTEFGAQAVPDSADFMDPARWPELDWDRLESTHGLQRANLARLGLDPSEFATFDQWRSATQRYQADLIRRHIETLRRLKYRPAGGFCQFLFEDCHPAVSWSVIDHEGVAKAGLGTLASACAPVIVVADRLPAVLLPGDPVALDVHVVSDLRKPIEETMVEARLEWEGGQHEWAWQGDIPPDSCVRVGMVRAVTPERPPRLALTLRLSRGDEELATNSYSAVIAAEG